MGKLFDLDSPLMRALSRMADLIILNLLVLLFTLPAILIFTGGVYLSLPVFLILLLVWIASLLMGPALTGMHYVLLKMARDEEGYIIRSFFKSFKENFRQAILLAAIVMMVTSILLGDLYLMIADMTVEFPVMFRIPILIISIYLFMVSLWIFPVEARFVNTIGKTIRNAFFMSILAFPRTLAMTVMMIVPVVLFYFFGWSIMPILIMFGISAPSYVCACLYSKVFKRFEPEEEEPVSDENFSIKESEDEEQD